MSDLQQWKKAAVEDVVATHTVGVSEGKTVVGTGVAIIWEGHHLILTARHVWKATSSEDLNFGPKAGGGLVRNRPGEKKRFTEVSYGKKFAVSQVHSETQFDLAVIELSRPPSDVLNLEFFELVENSATSPAIDQEICLLGYPQAVAEEISEGTSLFSTASDFSQIETPTESLPGFDEVLHLIFENSLNKNHALGPHGFSGSGIWWRKGTGLVWSTDLHLGGIVLSYLPEARKTLCSPH